MFVSSKVLKAEDSEKFAESCANNNTKIFCSQVKKEHDKAKTYFTIVQGNNIPIDIANRFKVNYAETCQSEFANERHFIASLGT